MESKQDLIDAKKEYEKLLLTALETHHRLPIKLQSMYDEMIKEYIQELKIINKKIHERVA